MAASQRTVFVAFLLVAASACGKPSDRPGDSSSTSNSAAALADSAPQSQLALPVVAEPARDGDLVLRVTTTGQIRSDASVKLRTEVAGTVSDLLVRPGTRVTKGQVLAKLDPYAFDLAVREAQAAADESEQRYLESFVPESIVTGRGPTAEQRKALMNKAGLTGARLRLERAKFEQAKSVITSPVDSTSATACCTPPPMFSRSLGDAEVRSCTGYLLHMIRTQRTSIARRAERSRELGRFVV
jgi:multidrug efflux pump subunit AcrA (membrane-fusion protein)